MKEGMGMFKHDLEEWLKAAGIRAAKTAAEAAIGAIGSTAVIYGVDWKVVFGTVALSIVTSFLLSMKGLPELPVKGE